MQNSSIPIKFQTPFANSAGGGYIRVVPVPSQIGIQNGAASFTDGFPPYCFSAPGYPFGQDFNGLLKVVTQWGQWYQAGGLVAYDGTFSAQIGGYPKGAVVASATGFGYYWITSADNNTNDPDTGGSAWHGVVTLPLYGVDTGSSANAVAIQVQAALPYGLGSPLTSLTGKLVTFKKSAIVNTGASTLSITDIVPNTYTGNILRSDSTAVQGGDLGAAGTYTALCDGTNFILQAPVASQVNTIAGIVGWAQFTDSGIVSGESTPNVGSFVKNGTGDYSFTVTGTFTSLFAFGSAVDVTPSALTISAIAFGSGVNPVMEVYTQGGAGAGHQNVVSGIIYFVGK